jgi:hypothetical protein
MLLVLCQTATQIIRRDAVSYTHFLSFYVYGHVAFYVLCAVANVCFADSTFCVLIDYKLQCLYV